MDGQSQFTQCKTISFYHWQQHKREASTTAFVGMHLLRINWTTWLTGHYTKNSLIIKLTGTFSITSIKVSLIYCHFSPLIIFSNREGMKIISKDLRVRSKMKSEMSARNGDYIYQSTEVTTLQTVSTDSRATHSTPFKGYYLWHIINDTNSDRGSLSLN